MVNINQINELTQSMGGKTQAKQKPGENSDAFGSVLNSALEKAETIEGETKVKGLEEISAPGFELASLSSIVTGKTDKLLDMLDTYAVQLENPEFSLRNIAPVLEEINSKADALLEDSQFLGKEDSTLKSIAIQAAVTARTEYEKFQRGDYLT